MRGLSESPGPRILVAIEDLVRELVADELERRLIGPRWFTLEEAAERYRTTPAALRKRAFRGTLPGAARDGSRWLVDVAVYDEALKGGSLVPMTNGARAA